MKAVPNLVAEVAAWAQRMRDAVQPGAATTRLRRASASRLFSGPVLSHAMRPPFHIALSFWRAHCGEARGGCILYVGEGAQSRRQESERGALKNQKETELKKSRSDSVLGAFFHVMADCWAAARWSKIVMLWPLRLWLSAVCDRGKGRSLCATRRC